MEISIYISHSIFPTSLYIFRDPHFRIKGSVLYRRTDHFGLGYSFFFFMTVMNGCVSYLCFPATEVLRGRAGPCLLFLPRLRFFSFSILSSSLPLVFYCLARRTESVEPRCILVYITAELPPQSMIKNFKKIISSRYV